jgi:urease accessory protein
MIELTNKLKANTSTTETITLAFDERQRSRYKSQLDSGEEAWIILVGSARGGILRSGDVLKSTDGRVVKCKPSPSR